MKQKFNLRSFTSFSLFFSTVIMTITGIVLYFKPPGRVANWTNWTFIGFDKGVWEALHTIFSIAFVVFAVIHLFSLNWKGFVSYINRKNHSGIFRKSEFLYSIVVTAIMFFGTIFYLPPFEQIMDFSEYLTESWEVEETSAPVPHAESLTISELAYQLENHTETQLLNRMKKNNLKYEESDNLETIGLKNNLSPVEVYQMITKPSTQGRGLGRIKINDLIIEGKIDKEKVEVLFNELNLEIDFDLTLKDLGDKTNSLPIELFEKIKK